ncbi:ArnT family glycosyltransferase [Sphingomonas lenta]|uniref:4-amino-4-deoxy-L-arabinose transferase n=1 Tax=Sphingomonas lenta TaxID=1141887 RepID=A0A2A2SDL3_9SPHN|nr:glycosyltransferase family 39 protein [Sphingomonas lenta]PAX07328.1 4-amino-4-deoxy-L-arabinose transferase [Sphingomonas lenta]
MWSRTNSRASKSVPIPVRAAAVRPIRARCGAALACGALLLACAAFMFVDRTVPPIIIWDESRLAVNALEMHQRGWGLVTTFGFAPDLWNTKPPLMIWLMTASIRLFGASELSLRLPAMVAALGTLAIVFAFVRRATHSVPTAALAVALLAASVGFYGEHGARTGDYDALLCFFTTAYLALLHAAVHRPCPRRRTLLAVGVLVAGATMTKTAAGLIPGFGVALYLLACGRLRRAFTWRYVLLVPLALVPLAAFYLLRERLAPGYLEAVWYNDFAGRLSGEVMHQDDSPFYYLRVLLLGGLFSAGPLALLAPAGLAGPRGRARQALVFALCCVAGQLLLVTVIGTRLPQYILPALPWLAVACAITVGRRLPRFLGFVGAGRPTWAQLALPSALVAAAVVNIGVRTAGMRYDLLLDRAYYPQASYGVLLASLFERGVRRVAVVEPGFDLGVLRAYQPQLHFYALLWRERGLEVTRYEAPPQREGGEVMASCDPDLGRALLSRGGGLLEVSGCVASMPPTAGGAPTPRKKSGPG